MFQDTATVTLRAGRGGNGVIAWHRAKYLPKGGPYGGNGGDGACIILEADEGEPSLDHFRNKRLIKAENGADGGSNRRHGRNGRQLVLRVPCGTLVKDPETGTILYDLTKHQERVVLCQGGRGGRGNATFATPTNRAPAKCTPGRDGDERRVLLELKVIADVGLVGFPNAGKSTLLNALTHSPTKIGAYPFTTLHPNLGTVEFEDYTRMTIADIPGILEGASQGKGLGLEFLRHIERTRILLIVLDGTGTPEEDLAILRKEMHEYDPTLLDKPYYVIINKCDETVTVDIPHAIRLSALTGEGLDTLLNLLLHSQHNCLSSQP